MTEFTPTHLGQDTQYPTSFDPTLLEPIPRAPARQALGIGESLPFQGWDDWQAFEMGWLNSRGQGVAAVLLLRFPAQSPAIVESKSLKLYLQSFHMTQFASETKVVEQIGHDLKACLKIGPRVTLSTLPLDSAATKAWAPADWATLNHHDYVVQNIDQLDITCTQYQPAPELLKLSHQSEVIGMSVYYTDAFRSLCPVTGQPDFASIAVLFNGLNLDEASLAQYLNSFRLHQGFHEQCVEQIFTDLIKLGEFSHLAVIGRFTRRGGIDINPVRFLNQASEDAASYLQRRQVRQ